RTPTGLAWGPTKSMMVEAWGRGLSRQIRTANTAARRGRAYPRETCMRLSKSVLALSTLLLASGVAEAQVKFAYVGESSGSIAGSGGNFRDGVILAVEELNAKGGILKQKIELTLYDTQTNPGVA